MMNYLELLGLLLALNTAAAWDRSQIYVPHAKGAPLTLSQFTTNSTDHLKLLYSQSGSQSVLVGGRNALYNISVTDGGALGLSGSIQWGSTDAHRELCTLKGKQESDCQNYIRIYAQVNSQKALVCGTNSYKPMCRHYNLPLDGASGGDNEEAQGRCPYSPTHSSAYTFSDGHLFTGTVADFSETDSLIYREHQRTEQYDLKQLNQPAFVRATAYSDYVFFVFREIAMEYMNCGKAIYSRIGRVCRSDRGGPGVFIDRWTSFLKARINCSLPGDYPFYFDNVIAMTDIVNVEGQDVVYGVFRTPKNSIEGSAICAFRMADILEAFEGPFKAQKDVRSNWLPVSQNALPMDPRPGQCVEDSRTLPSSTVNFLKNHPLMERAVPAMHGEPLLVTTGRQQELESVVVVQQVGPNGKNYSILFAGTRDGSLLKFYSEVIDGTIRTTVVAEWQILPRGQVVKELTVVGDQWIVAVSGGMMVNVRVENCGNWTSCGACLTARDPMCGWNERLRVCESVGKIDGDGGKMLLHALDSEEIIRSVCPDDNWIEERVVTRGTVSSVGREPESGYLVHQHNNTTCSNGGPEVTLAGAYSAQTMAIALVAVAAVAVAVGALVGIVVGHKCRMECPLATGPLEHHRNQLTWSAKSRHLAHSKDINLLMNANHLYSPPSPHSTAFGPHDTPQPPRKVDNLGLVDLEGMDGKDRRHESKNSTESLEKDPHHFKTDTLKKVKKTYI